MKNLLLASLLCVSTFAAATEVRSIRTSNDFVEIGNSQAQVQSKLGSPNNVHHYVLRDRQDRPRAATDLSYTVDNEKYIVTIVNGNVYKIEWVR
ncbi:MULTISPECIES: hypothetical protein [Acinetobacter]|uniref:DUF2845 domain-containing protein n=1 Tax=Acinetobacter piscicola TaxID=2006115 RepID=A0A7S6VX35_9GAMM|nr:MULTISPECIES: hypothetical protein [Acinetobacter]QOW46453.1 hypothetical protein G0028_11405 [Acinetobacter piscicola]